VTVPPQSDQGIDANVERDLARAWWVAMMLAPSLEVCEALLRGESVPVDRLDQGEAVGVPGMHLEPVAGALAIQGERRDQDCAVNPDRVHRRNHPIAGGFRRVLQGADPATARGLRSQAWTCIDRQHAVLAPARVADPRSLRMCGVV